MNLKADELLKATGGRFLDEPAGEWPITKISTDTRMLGKDDAFFALKGARFDAHEFIGDALAKGARYLIVSKSKCVKPEHRKAANFILVDNTLKAYGDLAKYYRGKFRIPAVAVTGSCGKTTVKEILAHLLGAHCPVLKNRGTENNRVGVPKTILQLDESHKIMVLELGTSLPGEIDILASIVCPQVAILTQIGPSHLEGLKNPEGVREEKLKMIQHLERGGLLIVNGEDPYLAGVASGVHQLVRAGFSAATGEWFADQIWCHEKGTSFYLKGKDLFETQLIGRHNVINCLLALAAASCQGMDTESLQKGLAAFKPIGGRLNFRPVAGIQFIDDTYNSNPASFRAALETLKAYKTRGKKGIVCGDMLELGSAGEELHRSVGQLIAGILPDFVIAAGPLSRHLAEEAHKAGLDAAKIHEAKDSSEAGALCQRVASAGDMVLVKGSRGMHMEKVFECFTTS